MRKAPVRNQRKSSRKQLRQQNLLEVGVRNKVATEQLMRRLVTFFCVVVLVAISAGGIYYGAREGLRKFFWENPDYTLTEVKISTDGSLAREQILDASGIHPGANIFRINISKAQEKLTQLPQIETVEIQRLLPNKISINVTERKPIAWIAARYDEDPTVYASSFLVDARGTLMKGKNQLSEYFHLPVIYGVRTEDFDTGQTISTPEIKAALDLVRLNSDGAAQARFQVRSIDVSKGWCMVVTDRTHARITFGLDRIDSQLDRLMMVLDHIEQSKRELQTVNLMVQRNLPVTFAPSPDQAIENAEAAPSEGAAGTATPGEAPQPSVKKAEPVKSPGAGKSKPAAQVKKAEPVHGKSKSTKPVKRATPVNSQDKSNG